MIRKLNALDLLQVLAFFDDYDKEDNAWFFLPHSLEKVMHSVVRGLDDTRQYIVGDFSQDGILKGVVWGALTDHVWTDVPIAMDLFVVVHEKYRGGTSGYRLVRSFKRWAKEQGAGAIVLGANSGIKDNIPASRLYEGMGLTRCGATFIQEL